MDIINQVLRNIRYLAIWIGISILYWTFIYLFIGFYDSQEYLSKKGKRKTLTFCLLSSIATSVLYYVISAQERKDIARAISVFITCLTLSLIARYNHNNKLREKCKKELSERIERLLAEENDKNEPIIQQLMTERSRLD
jgi:hypothetical protein